MYCFWVLFVFVFPKPPVASLMYYLRDFISFSRLVKFSSMILWKIFSMPLLWYCSSVFIIQRLGLFMAYQSSSMLCSYFFLNLPLNFIKWFSYRIFHSWFCFLYVPLYWWGFPLRFLFVLIIFHFQHYSSLEAQLLIFLCLHFSEYSCLPSFHKNGSLSSGYIMLGLFIPKGWQ